MSSGVDNATAHAAADYEREVTRTIPFHAEMQRTAVDVVLAVHPKPARWLDTGAGPGNLVSLVHERAPETELWLADPSEAMLAIARTRVPPERALLVKSEDLPDVGTFDAITAIQCHHYGDMNARERAVVRCRERLAKNGVLVVFENVRAETDDGHTLQRARWAAWQHAQGRSDAEVEHHLAREGKAFHPIRVSEHLELFQRLGFGVIELVWRSYGQAGFHARRT